MTNTPSPLPWWAWRRRAARYRFLERVARTEIRLALNGTDQVGRSFEGTYLALVNSPDREVVDGLCWVTLAAVGNSDGDRAEIGVRMPFGVRL